MKKHRRILSTLVILTALLCGVRISVSAESIISSESIPFSITPVLPSNQSEDTDSYISVDIDTNDEFEQIFEFKITNESNDPHKIEISIVDAYTSPSGNIQYINEETKNSKIIDSNYKLSNHTEEKVSFLNIMPKESLVVPIAFKIDNIDGQILGGISFSVADNKEEIETLEDSFSIQNEIRVISGILINSKSSKIVEFQLGRPYIAPMPSYYIIKTPITNNSPYLIQDAVLEYNVLLDNTELFKGSLECDFAPNTYTELYIPFDYNKIIDSKEYDVKYELVYSVDGSEYSTGIIEEKFEYKKEENDNVEKTEEVNINIEQPKVIEDELSLVRARSVERILISLLIFVTITFISVMLYRRRKSLKEGCDIGETKKEEQNNEK